MSVSPVDAPYNVSRNPFLYELLTRHLHETPRTELLASSPAGLEALKKIPCAG